MNTVTQQESSLKMEKELEALRARVLELEQELARPKTPISQDDLPPEFYRRYGRQMMLDGFGLSGKCLIFL